MTTVHPVYAALPDVEVGGMAVHHLVLRNAARLGDKAALLDAATGRTVTYRALARGVERVAAALAARGFAKGDVLAVHSPNVPDYALAVYGAMAAGGTVTGADPTLTAGELAVQLAGAGARLLVTAPPLLEVATEAARTAGVAEVLVFGGSFDALVEHDLPPAAAVVDPDRDVAALPFSSGTTGLPKGVELTHAALVTNVRQALAVLGFAEDDVILAVAPFCHVIGLNLLLAGGLAAGATVVTLPRFDLEAFLRAIQNQRVTLTVVVPPVVRALAAHPLVDRFDLSSLRALGVGAAPLYAATEQRCAERLGCAVSQGMGMTETGALIAVGDPHTSRRGSVGRLLPNTEARVVDPDSGADLSAGRTGELWVRGPQLMRGYRGRPEETAATVDAEGWLHTGDLCHFDEDGHLYVVDRLKELIKVRGHQVPPAELEALLCLHPAVADAAVVPRPDPDSGEVAVAHVVLRSPVGAEELLAFVAERVAPFKRLAAVTFTTAIPRSPTGKILRRVLGGAVTGGLRAWAVSVAATAVSAYALDAIATAAGVTLVASGLLGDLGHRPALALLVASYAVWAWGLRANLRANQELLTTTGTSTNVLSKAAHDLTRRHTTSPRAARLAAAAGYAVTEVAKEVPYYAGAFGAAVLTDSVTATGALVFLAGANLGAAGYEYGLARLTTAFLRRRRYASFDTDWEPAAYLDGYYRTVEPDEVATIAFFVDALRGAERDRPVLFFGVGPTLHHVFAAAELASEIHLGDYLPANLAEIRRWLDRDPGAHDWRPFVRHTLRCEGNAEPTDEEVTAREELTRKKVTDLVQVDARHPRPVDRCYPTVVSAYCADSATADRATWARYMRHITGLVEPGGLFVTSALRRCRGYTVAGRSFPSAGVDEHDLRAVLRTDFATPSVEVRQVPQEATHGYAGIVLAAARRTEDPASGRVSAAGRAGRAR